MASEFGKDSLKRAAKVQLGWPTVCVELSEDAFDDAVFECELWMLTHMGQTRKTTIEVSDGTTEYDLPLDCESVVDVALPQQWSGTLPLALDIEGLEDFYYGQFFRFGSRSGGFNSDIYQHLQYIDMTQRTLSTDPERVWEEHDRKLLLHPGDVSGTAIVWYLSNEVNYDRLTVQQKFLMRRYVVAHSMMTLGRIRTKYSEIPGSGGKISLNGDSLVSSAENEFALLDEKVKLLVEPTGFITG